MRNNWPIALVVMLARLTHAADPAQYAGSDACLTCHEDISNGLAKSPHHTIGLEESWKGKACEACHGPGAKHAETTSATDIINPSKLAPGQADKLCATCHSEQLRGGAGAHGHSREQVACTSCHKVHADGPHGIIPQTRAGLNALCAGCHANVVAQFQKPFRHRVPENAMTCTDCHNPHGTVNPAMQRSFAANEKGCFQCHGDKRGPFPFEHAPVRFEGCGSCHEAHGSANPRMLTRAEVRFTCLECHSSLPAFVGTNAKLGVVPPAFHNLQLPQYRNCTVCHQKVHGSYTDRNLLR